MKNMQTKFFEILQSHLDDKRDGELIVNHSYSNTGQAYIQHKAGFENYVQFSFSFQTDYASFTINGKDIKSVFFGRDDLFDVIDQILSFVPDPVHPSQGVAKV